MCLAIGNVRNGLKVRGDWDGQGQVGVRDALFVCVYSCLIMGGVGYGCWLAQ